MLYLAHVFVEKSEYMVDGVEEFDEIRLVDAADEVGAKTKVEEHYESKTSEYSIYYRVTSCKITSIIK